MRDIGLHLRLQNTMHDLYKRAHELHLSLFQCFFIFQSTGKLIKLSADDVKVCRAMNSLFAMRILHGSYWINLANSQTRHRALERELSLAKKLDFTHIVLHPGSARGSENREQSIDFLARTVNMLLKNEHDIQIVLENTAHGGMSIGGDLQDFYLLKQKMDQPEKLKFCIDTAHAFSYGYDIRDAAGQDAFIALLEKTIGINSIVLIHMNDTHDSLGSKLDKHAMPGAGHIGLDALKRFVMNPSLANIPLIMEIPPVSQEEEQKIVELVKNWHE